MGGKKGGIEMVARQEGLNTDKTAVKAPLKMAVYCGNVIGAN